MKKEVISVGDEFTVEFVKNQKGGKPICRIDGIVGFIDPTERDFVAPCSSWAVKVKEIRETCLIVIPLVKIRSAKENILLFEEKIETLRVQKAERIKPVKSGGLYKSFQELKAEKELL